MRQRATVARDTVGERAGRARQDRRPATVMPERWCPIAASEPFFVDTYIWPSHHYHRLSRIIATEANARPTDLSAAHRRTMSRRDGSFQRCEEVCHGEDERLPCTSGEPSLTVVKLTAVLWCGGMVAIQIIGDQSRRSSPRRNHPQERGGQAAASGSGTVPADDEGARRAWMVQADPYPTTSVHFVGRAHPRRKRANARAPRAPLCPLPRPAATS